MEVYHYRFSRVVPGKSSLLNGTVFREKVWSSLGDYFFTLTLVIGCHDDLYFLQDKHPISKELVGIGTGLLKVYPAHDSHSASHL